MTASGPQLLPGCEAQAISNLVWSCSKRQQLLSSAVVNAICVRYLEVLPQASSQNVGNLLYGFAIMGATPSIESLEGCANHLAHNVGHAEAQGIANSIWALGELGYCPSRGVMQELLQADALRVRLNLVHSSTSSTSC